jgi:hypothetical protein
MSGDRACRGGVNKSGDAMGYYSSSGSTRSHDEGGCIELPRFYCNSRIHADTDFRLL